MAVSAVHSLPRNADVAVVCSEWRRVAVASKRPRSAIRSPRRCWSGTPRTSVEAPHRLLIGFRFVVSKRAKGSHDASVEAPQTPGRPAIGCLRAICTFSNRLKPSAFVLNTSTDLSEHQNYQRDTRNSILTTRARENTREKLSKIKYIVYSIEFSTLS